MQTPSPTPPLRLIALPALALLGLAITLASLLATPSRASANTNQISMIQDDGMLRANPAATLTAMRGLGASTVRVFVDWYAVAPHPASLREPKFSASDPNAYPASSWQVYDAIVQDAKQDGLTVDLEVTGGAPRWAQASGIPPQGRKDHNFSWKPSAKDYGQFVHAVGKRYDGHFTPKGQTSPLPAVRFWSFYNEPNFGQNLAPQAIDGSTVALAPEMYRGLVDAGWTALHQTGHASNTVLIGELAAKGKSGPVTHSHPQGLPGNYSQTRPLVFLRTLYCLDENYHELRGSAARAVDCPTTAAASRRFRAANPGLFEASGFGMHAYDSREAPDADPSHIDPSFATFPVLGRLVTALDHVNRAYGSHKAYKIYNDEYGYITSPPEARSSGDPSPARAAAELNQAEFISYKSSRIAAYGQYLLDDPSPGPNPGFASGLYTSKGKPKATLAAYRLPLWLPKTTVSSADSAEIWGGARPAHFGALDAKSRQTVEIQLQKGGRGSFTTVHTVTVASQTGYFDIHLKLPFSGRLRLAYTYPAVAPLMPVGLPGTAIDSRVVSVKVG